MQVFTLILFDIKRFLNINTACDIQHLPFQRSFLHKIEKFVPDIWMTFWKDFEENF
jgi:hypothetical protein